MDGVGGGNGKFTFLINSRLSDPLFITAAESTAALCSGVSMSAARGLFGDVVVSRINPDDGGCSVVKMGDVSSSTDSSRAEVTCCASGMGSSSGCFTDILSSRSS